VHVAVIIATRNRAHLLGPALASVLGQDLRPSAPQVEVLVADNGPDDETRDVVHATSEGARFPVRYLCEPKRGKPFALNAALLATEAEVCVFFDDDQIADKHWLSSLLHGLQRHPEASGVSGRVEIWEADVRGSWQKLFASRFQSYNGPVDCRADWLNGGNAALRRAAILAVGGFDPRFPRGQDTKLLRDLTRAGHIVYYTPAAVIYHRAEADRLTLRGWVAQLRQQAYGDAFLARWAAPGEEGDPVQRWVHARRRCLLKLPYTVLMQGLCGASRDLGWAIQYSTAIRSYRALGPAEPADGSVDGAIGCA